MWAYIISNTCLIVRLIRSLKFHRFHPQLQTFSQATSSAGWVSSFRLLLVCAHVCELISDLVPLRRSTVWRYILFSTVKARRDTMGWQISWLVLLTHSYHSTIWLRGMLRRTDGSRSVFNAADGPDMWRCGCWCWGSVLRARCRVLLILWNTRPL